MTAPPRAKGRFVSPSNLARKGILLWIVMMRAVITFLAFALPAAAFVVPRTMPSTATALKATEEGLQVSRRDALSSAALGAAFLAAGAPAPAFARGRATQIAAWSRYGSRVEGMRSWLAGDLKAMIASSDFAGLKEATGTKKSTVASYLGALDLWAASYSDANPSPKTVAMQGDVEAMRTATTELNVLAKKALGEDVKKSGGFFGIGAKDEVVPTGAAMAKLLNEVRDKAVAAYNNYCEVNNEGHPFEVDELMTI
eukprot:CAMPEP_0172589488 /NCGR_PEP_ID=MMETSP1068-20121228/8201_1 /TAXON_ID=35684 /ORGANISM="Pseudopedinella elastica, Strain CCMP716" /LENGTH=254 /DNA_ID=CAMNT_0013385097 /DNA_START=1 /DNA_END=765 /DNA_ORIENTATION=-